MGTNYYLHREDDVCPHCGHAKGPRHIGKSSYGWCFALHVIPEESINDLADWEREWQKGEIRDEYGGVFSPEEMRAIVVERKGRAFNAKRWQGYYNEAEFHRQNHSQRGPEGLLRHQIDPEGRWCIGHGAGTWDLMPGEFS